MRDAKGAQIYEGTNQIHREIVAGRAPASGSEPAAAANAIRGTDRHDPTHAGPNGDIFIVSAARTPIGKFGGALSGVPATELGGVAIRAAVERAGLDPATRPDRRGAHGPGPPGRRRARRPRARRRSRPACPTRTSATTINRVCGSGLKAIMLAAAEIRAGDAEVVVAGGMESMNRRPYLLPGRALRATGSATAS